ncbi:MAG: single-stranded DNA-binding protein [Atribacterota bacterium]|nr:single-stranded DNA-binding protein [Candidatus Atribacteria bacterium]
MTEGQKRENKVRFQGEISKEPRVFKGTEEPKNSIIKLFLKGDTKAGNVYMTVKIAGTLAEKLLDKVPTWKVGEEIIVEGELDWESFEKDGKKQYSTRINAFQVYRVD